MSTPAPATPLPRAADPDLTPRPTVQIAPVSLLTRSRALRAQARHVHPVVAAAYRRRAAELQLEAWLHAVRRSPTDIDTFTTRAA